MALIEYVEPVDPANFVAAIGVLVCLLVVAFILYRFYLKFIQWLDVSINKDIKYALVEELALDKMAKAKGIDLDKELIKRRVIHEKRKDIQSKIKEKVYEEWFGKEKE